MLLGELYGEVAGHYFCEAGDLQGVFRVVGEDELAGGVLHHTVALGFYGGEGFVVEEEDWSG